MRHIKYLVGAIFLLCVSAFFVFNVQADVALFFSDTYVEQGVEIPDETGTTTRIQYEHTWTDFKGVVPDGAEVNSIFLHLTWSKVERTDNEEIRTQPQEMISSETATTSPDMEVQSDTPDAEKQSGGGGREEENIEAVESITETNSPEPVANETVEEKTGEKISKPVDSEAPSVETEPVPPLNEPDAPEEEKADEPAPPSEEDTSPSPTSGFEEVSLLKLFPLVLAEFEEPATTDTTVGEDVTVSMSAQESDSEALLTVESVSTSTDLMSSDVVTEVPKTYSFEVLYSLDGTTWQLLKQVGFDEEHDLFIDLTSLGYDALTNLRIAIRYSIPSDYHEKISIDSLRLELGYGEPLIEDVGGEIAYDERTPNFPMSTLISDVESENIRAVVLERGGMLEFWYSVTDVKTGEVVWNKILGGGPIDGTAPIAITKRTIFWLDRNQQTLFGFAVDEESIFSASFQDPENKIFILPFTDENGKQWEASFNSEKNILEFNKVKNQTI